jgi:hypothetical protein
LIVPTMMGSAPGHHAGHGIGLIEMAKPDRLATPAQIVDQEGDGSRVSFGHHVGLARKSR